MNMSVVFSWLAVALGFVVALPSLWMCCEAIWPERTARKAGLALTGLWKSLFLGLIPFLIFVASLSRLGKAGLAGVIPIGLLLLWGFIGGSGLARAVGERLWPYLAAERPWKQTMRGGFVIAGTALLPVVGWLFILPLVLILGWGVSLRAIFAGRNPSSPPAPAGAPAL